MKELSLRPYVGKLFVVKTAKQYEAAHLKFYKTKDILNNSQAGRCAGDEVNGKYIYLVWANSNHTLAHEFAHVLFHLFKRCDIDPREANGEPFCYMLSQLLLDYGKIK